MKYKTKRFIVKATALILALALLLFIATVFSGCTGSANGSGDSAEPAKTTVTKTIIKLPNGEVIEGRASRYMTYGYGGVQITIDGVVYTTHMSNVAIIKTEQ